MQKADNHYDVDMTMIRIQALEWVQRQIQDLILNNLTTDWPVYNNEQMCLEKQRVWWNNPLLKVAIVEYDTS